MKAAARIAALLTALCTMPASAQSPARVMDDFEHIDAWKAVASDNVSATLRQIDGASGKALCLAYDFNGVSGYAVARRVLPMTYPPNFEYALQLRGSGPVNNLEIKLGDASGDNVWWVNKPNYPLPGQWTPMKLKKRQIAFAWGPTQDKSLRATQTFEVTISAGKGGGKGEVCIDQLMFRELPADDTAPPVPIATASSALPGGAPANAVDGDQRTAWRTPKAGAQTLMLDLGREREFGGLTLHWVAGKHASRYRIALSDDGLDWREVRAVTVGNGGSDPIALPESEARYLRLQLDDGPGEEYALGEIAVEDLAFAATPNDFIKAIAKDAPRGWYPRGFIGEQPYWTIVGIDGGLDQGLMGEDGAVEFTKGGASVLPMVISDGTLVTWADVDASQSLQDGYLPIPSVQWRHRDFGLRVTAFARGDANQSQMLVRYRLDNPTAQPREYVLALTVQPWQVNPPSQFLNTTGGSVPIGLLTLSAGGEAMVGTSMQSGDLHTVVRSLQAPDALLAAAFDQGTIAARLAAGEAFSNPDRFHALVEDEARLASGALLYRMRLDPGESREVVLMQPLSAIHVVDAPSPLVTEENREPGQGFDVDAAQRAVAAQWHDNLDRVSIRVPAQGQHLVDSLHTALAHMLISRTGPRLQPGTRSYARAWIRDGAMISEALLRMGREDVAGDFLRFYAPYQFASGKVPCCVDDRGSDPVPENDSQGELIHLVAEVYRYTHDRGLLEAMWPHVAGAVQYMEVLRAGERTEANRARNAAFFGLMPASISHEGYSAKPMHSYWDDFWALRGYKDAVDIARWLGRDAEATAFATSRDQFRADLYASIAIATRQNKIDFIPGSAELGDFDATSTTIALSPAGEQQRLPQALLQGTFQRYWREFAERRDGRREWKDYTPYELRAVGSFIRLGWRGRAHEALDYFLAGQQPRGWNQWAEVVSHTPRKPFFVGDLPHAWVESDFAGSVLDMFAYHREEDQALVVADGIPVAWLDGAGVSIAELRTPDGRLGYTLRHARRTFVLQLAAGLQVPHGGVVFRWPYPGQPGKATINGRPLAWTGSELRIRSVPAAVRISIH